MIQSSSEQFDTSDQKKWETALERAASNEGDEIYEEFPKKAPSDPATWFELYKKVPYQEYENEEPDDYYSDRKGTSEYEWTLKNAKGKEVDI